MFFDYSKDFKVMNVSHNNKAYNIYRYNILNMLSNLLKTIDFNNTKFKIGCAGNIITFYLSDDMCIEFYFTILGTYYIRFYKYNNLNILQFSMTDILNLLTDGFEYFSNIDDIISDIIKFKDEQYFIYSKPILNSLKTAFMKTY